MSLFNKEFNFQKDGKNLTIFVDISNSEFIESPLTSFDMLGKVAIFSLSKYSHLGHQVLKVKNKKDSFPALRKVAKTTNLDSLIFVPINLINHSYIYMNLGLNEDKFDGSDVGFIYCTHKEAKDWHQIKSKSLSQENIETIINGFEEQLDLYNNWFNGNVFDVSITILDEDEEEVFSEGCGGFYGLDFNTNGLVEYIRENIPDTVPKSELNKIFSSLYNIV